MPGDHGKSHGLENLAESLRVGAGVLDELETVRSQGIIEEILCHGRLAYIRKPACRLPL
jgi:hypothetical protein